MKPPLAELLQSRRQELGAERVHARAIVWQKPVLTSGDFALRRTTYFLGRALVDEDPPSAIPSDVDIEGLYGIALWSALTEEWERTIRTLDLPSVSLSFKLGGDIAFSAHAEEDLDQECFSPAADRVVEERFKGLVDEWQADTFFTSSTNEMILHSAYQQIIGLGEPAIPFLIRQLGHEGAREWFWALRSIAGEDPADGTESVSDAVAAWRRWAGERGYAA